jgi:hypothetical protein
MEKPHRSHGVPLETYELTKRDHRDQRASEEIRDAVAKLPAERRSEEAADPSLREQREAIVRQVWDKFLSIKTPDHALMRWRVRLYCGHIAETRRHVELEEPRMHGSRTMRCPECDMDPALIVAYEPLGTVTEPPGARPGPPPQLPRLSRAQLERRVAELEAEVARLRDGNPKSQES